MRGLPPCVSRLVPAPMNAAKRWISIGYIFPAMGMAVYATQSTRVTEEMFIIAAKAVAEQVSDASLETGLIYPPQSQILEASLHVAIQVAEHIFDKGLARVSRPRDIAAHIRAAAYRPVYPT